jgi:hypothetical protein
VELKETFLSLDLKSELSTGQKGNIPESDVSDQDETVITTAAPVHLSPTTDESQS